MSERPEELKLNREEGEALIEGLEAAGSMAMKIRLRRLS